MSNLVSQGYVAAKGLQPRRRRGGVFKPRSRSPIPGSAASSTSSLLSLFSSTSDYELIPHDQLKDYVVYSSSGFTPTHQIKLKPEPTRSQYKGSMSDILRAAMMLTNKPAGSEQDVVCKEILEYGDTGTGEEALIAADAFTDEHECIVPYFGITVFAHLTPVRRTWLVSPDMDGGDLDSWLTKGETDNPTVYRQLAEDIIVGLGYLHSRNIIHGDVRTNNIFLWSEKTSQGNRLRAKIADFGLARYDAQIKPEELRTRPTVRKQGARRYLGSEHLIPDEPFPNWREASSAAIHRVGAISKEKPNDVWALGMTILHLYSRCKPWNETQTDDEVIDLVRQGLRPTFPGTNAFKRGLNFVLWRILQDCWCTRPSHRPTTQQVLDIWQNGSSQDLLEQPAETTPFDSLYWIDLSDSIQPVSAEQQHLVCGHEEISAVWRLDTTHATGYVPVRLVRPMKATTISGGWNKDFRHEICRWRKIRHANLRPLLGVYFEPHAAMWYAVAPVYSDFQSWSQTRAAGMEMIGRSTPEAWLKLLLDIASALSFLHMQSQPILHGAVCLENIMCPISVVAGNVLADTTLSVHACLSDFRSMRTAVSGDTSQDVQEYGRLVVQVIDHWATRFNPSPVRPALLETITGGCARAGASISIVAVSTLEEMLRNGVFKSS